MSAIQADIEAGWRGGAGGRGAARGGRRRQARRVFIDHPEGVSLELCERVTKHLPEVRERYALEVSSPGPERPLSKPDHFRRYLGRRARVRTRGHDGHTSFTGELVGADRRRRDRSPPTPAWCPSLRRHPPIEPRGEKSHVTGDRRGRHARSPGEGHLRGEAHRPSRTRCCRPTRSSPAPCVRARHLDPDLGEYRVEELILPEELEDQLLDEAEEQATASSSGASTPRPAR